MVQGVIQRRTGPGRWPGIIDQGPVCSGRQRQSDGGTRRTARAPDRRSCCLADVEDQADCSRVGGRWPCGCCLKPTCRAVNRLSQPPHSPKGAVGNAEGCRLHGRPKRQALGGPGFQSSRDSGDRWRSCRRATMHGLGPIDAPIKRKRRDRSSGPLAAESLLFHRDLPQPPPALSPSKAIGRGQSGRFVADRLPQGTPSPAASNRGWPSSWRARRAKARLWARMLAVEVAFSDGIAAKAPPRSPCQSLPCSGQFNIT